MTSARFQPRGGGELQGDDIEQRDDRGQGKQAPAVPETGEERARDGEPEQRHGDDEPGELLRRTRRTHPRGGDEHPGARRKDVEERDDDDRVEDLDGERALDLRDTPRPHAGEVRDREARDAHERDRHEHPDELPGDDVQIMDRRRQKQHERAVLLLERERRRDERDAADRRKQGALRSEDEDRSVEAGTGRVASARDDEEQRHEAEDALAEQRSPVAKDLPADLAPGDGPGLSHARASRMVWR